MAAATYIVWAGADAMAVTPATQASRTTPTIATTDGTALCSKDWFCGQPVAFSHVRPLSQRFLRRWSSGTQSMSATPPDELCPRDDADDRREALPEAKRKGTAVDLNGKCTHDAADRRDDSHLRLPSRESDDRLSSGLWP
jgi:hypothetical protein